MSSFISPALWDRGEQPGRGVRRLNMQVCFTYGASVCFFVYSRALVCVYLGYSAPRLQRWRRACLWSWKLFTRCETCWLKRKHKATTIICRLIHKKAEDVWFEAVKVVLNKVTQKFPTDPTVTPAVSFHCIGFSELSITHVSLWVFASTEVWLRWAASAWASAKVCHGVLCSNGYDWFWLPGDIQRRGRGYF